MKKPSPQEPKTMNHHGPLSQGTLSGFADFPCPAACLCAFVVYPTRNPEQTMQTSADSSSAGNGGPTKCRNAAPADTFCQASHRNKRPAPTGRLKIAQGEALGKPGDLTDKPCKGGLKAGANGVSADGAWIKSCPAQAGQSNRPPLRSSRLCERTPKRVLLRRPLGFSAAGL